MIGLIWEVNFGNYIYTIHLNEEGRKITQNIWPPPYPNPYILMEEGSLGFYLSIMVET